MLDAFKDKLTKKDVLHTCHVNGAVSVLRTDKPAVTHQTFQQEKGTSLYRRYAFLNSNTFWQVNDIKDALVFFDFLHSRFPHLWSYRIKAIWPHWEEVFAVS